jgi:hypothetical protein
VHAVLHQYFIVLRSLSGSLAATVAIRECCGSGHPGSPRLSCGGDTSFYITLIFCMHDYLHIEGAGFIRTFINSFGYYYSVCILRGLASGWPPHFFYGAHHSTTHLLSSWGPIRWVPFPVRYIQGIPSCQQFCLVE